MFRPSSRTSRPRLTSFPKENIPPSIRSIIGISKLLRSLLPNDRSSSSTGDYRFIQNIYFLPHYQDPPSAQPKCKGFALLTLSDPSVASHLLASFPYHHRTPANKDGATVPADHDNHDDEASPEELEARKAGFRTLSKERWEALQSEYVEYRDALLHRIATSSSSSTAPATTVPNPPSPSPDKNENNVPESADVAPSRDHQAPPSTTSQLTPSRYPPGCVIFVRHVPTDTNKTALRARFSALLADDGNDNDNRATAALDYVDYTKGLDSVRLFLLFFLKLPMPCQKIVLFALDDAGARLIAAEAIRTRCGSRGGGDRARVVGRATRGDVLGVRTRKGALARDAALTGGAQGSAGRWRRCHASRRRRSVGRKWCAKAAETVAMSDLDRLCLPILLTPLKVTIVTIYNSTHRHTQYRCRKL